MHKEMLQTKKNMKNVFLESCICLGCLFGWLWWGCSRSGLLGNCILQYIKIWRTSVLESHSCNDCQLAHDPLQHAAVNHIAAASAGGLAWLGSSAGASLWGALAACWDAVKSDSRLQRNETCLFHKSRRSRIPPHDAVQARDQMGEGEIPQNVPNIIVSIAKTHSKTLVERRFRQKMHSTAYISRAILSCLCYTTKKWNTKILLRVRFGMAATRSFS